MLLTLMAEFVFGAIFVLLFGWIMDCIGPSVEAIFSKIFAKTEEFAGLLKRGFIKNPYPVRMGCITASIIISLLLM